MIIPNNANDKLEKKLENYLKSQDKKLKSEINKLLKTSGYTKKTFEKKQKSFQEIIKKNWKISDFASRDFLSKINEKISNLKNKDKNKKTKQSDHLNIIAEIDIAIRILFHHKNIEKDITKYEFFLMMKNFNHSYEKFFTSDEFKNEDEKKLIRKISFYTQENLQDIFAFFTEKNSIQNLNLKIKIGKFPKEKYYECLTGFSRKRKKKKFVEKFHDLENENTQEVLFLQHENSRKTNEFITKSKEKLNSIIEEKTEIEKKEVLEFLKKFSDIQHEKLFFKTKTGKEIQDYHKFYERVLDPENDKLNLPNIVSIVNSYFFLQKKIYFYIDSNVFFSQIELHSIIDIFDNLADYIRIEESDLSKYYFRLLDHTILKIGTFSSIKFGGQTLFSFLNEIDNFFNFELEKTGIKIKFLTKKQTNIFKKDKIISSPMLGGMTEIEFLQFRMILNFLSYFKIILEKLIAKKDEAFSKPEIKMIIEINQIYMDFRQKIFTTKFQKLIQDYPIFFKLLESRMISNVEKIIKKFAIQNPEIKKSKRPFSKENLYILKSEESNIPENQILKTKFEILQNLTSEIKNPDEKNLDENLFKVFGYCVFYSVFSEFLFKSFSHKSELKKLETEKEMITLVQEKLKYKTKKIKNHPIEKNIGYYSRRTGKLYFKEFRDLDFSRNDEDNPNYKNKIKGSGMPSKYKKDLYQIAKNIDSSGPMSSTMMSEKNYLDKVLSFPWNQKSHIDYDLDFVSKTLNELQYSFEIPKQKILDDVATIQISDGKIKPSIICLTGKPGTGKTFFAQNLAKALKVPFEKISLAGLDDQSVLIGQRRGWVGAHVGRIAKSMIQNKSKNMVFLLDEIDKTGGKKGNTKSVESVLLDILDQEQNDDFTDLFMEIPIDLSNVWFVTTANEVEHISAPLRDRLEILEVKAYSDFEKKTIIKNYIIPILVKENFIDTKKVKIKPEIFEFLIDEYGNIDGFRTVKKLMKSALRHANFEILKNNRKRINLNIKFIKKTIWEQEKKPFGFS